MVYIKPIMESDKRRWLGFLSAEESPAKHCHPMPVESKIGSQLFEDLQNTVSRDPSKTASQISLGLGVGYMPVTKSEAAANKGMLRHVINQIKLDINGSKAIDLIKNFDKFIKNNIDERDTAACLTEGLDAEVLDRCTPYLRYNNSIV